MKAGLSKTDSEVTVKRRYEAMFLVDSAEAAGNWDGVNAAIKNILEKSGVEIVSMKKWDERRLAYDIAGKSRGTYILCYFRADGKRIREIEREVQLSERIMRVLILCVEGREEAEVQRDSSATVAEKQEQEAAEKQKQEAAEKQKQEAMVGVEAQRADVGAAAEVVEESEKPKVRIRRRKGRSETPEAAAEGVEHEQAERKDLKSGRAENKKDEKEAAEQ